MKLTYIHDHAAGLLVVYLDGREIWSIEGDFGHLLDMIDLVETINHCKDYQRQS